MRLSLKLGPLFMAGLAFLFTACATPPSPAPKPWFHLFPSKSQPSALTKLWKRTREPRQVWRSEVRQGKPAITIYLADQRAVFTRGGELVGETGISTGRDGYDTPPGDYRVIEKDKDHRSNLYGQFVDRNGEVLQASADLTLERTPPGARFVGAPMPYFLRFQDGYGLHAGHLPGHRASHGCVRLPLTMARHFYESAPLGTPVTVLP
jgi:lipoprotein-anchoring transpeptidase ErfK/SrfK